MRKRLIQIIFIEIIIVYIIGIIFRLTHFELGCINSRTLFLTATITLVLLLGFMTFSGLGKLLKK